MALLIRADRASALVFSSTGAEGTDCLRIRDGIFGGRFVGGGRGTFLGFLAARFATSANEFATSANEGGD